MKRDHITFWIQRFRKLDVTKPEQRQRLIDCFVNAIYLFDDKLVITFNYKKGSETIDLGDIVDTVDNSVSCSDFCLML